MANIEEKLEMDPKKNVKIKKTLLETGIFEKASYTPYIGDGYGEAKEKILFIGDCKLPHDKHFLEETKNFPKVNYCTQIISYCNRETTNRKIRKEIKKEMNLKGKRERPTFSYPQKILGYTCQNKTNLENTSYCNFVYDRFERIKEGSIKKNEIPSGEDLNKYFQALAVIINKLKQKKIVFVDTSTEFEVNNRKRSDYFEKKKFSDWIKDKHISYEIITDIKPRINENSDSSDQEYNDWIICKDNFEMISRELSNTNIVEQFRRHEDITNLNQTKFDKIAANFPNTEFNDEIWSMDAVDCSVFFLCLKKLYETHRAFLRLMQRKDKGCLYQKDDEMKNEGKFEDFISLLAFLNKKRLYIESSLIPSMLEYIREIKKLNDEMIPRLGNNTQPSIEGFDTYMAENGKKSASGLHNTLKMLFFEINMLPSKRSVKYKRIMEEKIFKKRTSFPRDFKRLINKDSYTSFKENGDIEPFDWNEFNS